MEIDVKHSWKRNIAALALAISTGLVAGSANAAGACNGLSGYYGNVTAIVVGQDGKTVNVTLAGGRPNAYGSCSGNQLTVNFTDDKTIKGVFDGKTISWDNGTKWTKQ
jgi:hypothetical protein